MLITPVWEKKIHFFFRIYIFEFASTGNGHSKSFKNELVSIRYKHIVMCRHLHQIKAKLSLSIFSFPIDVTIRDWCCHLQETESHNTASKLLQQLDIVTTRCSFLNSRLLKKTFQSQKKMGGRLSRSYLSSNFEHGTRRQKPTSDSQKAQTWMELMI